MYIKLLLYHIINILYMHYIVLYVLFAVEKNNVLCVEMFYHIIKKKINE